MTTTAPLVFVDTETLGLDADVHPIWECALIIREPDKADREYVWQIEPTPRELSLAHPMALEIGRFDERFVREGSFTAEEFAQNLWRTIPEGAHLVGAVVSFDEERLRRLLWRFGYTPPWHYHLIDVEALAVGWIAAGGIPGTRPTPLDYDPCPPWKSSDLSLAVGVDPDKFEKHTALGDARWARAIYRAVMDVDDER